MKKLIPILLFAFITLEANSQVSVGLGLGGNTTNARYKNGEGKLNANLNGMPGAYFSGVVQFNLGHEGSYFKNKRMNAFVLGVGYKKGQIKDKESAILKTWQLDYIASELLFRHYIKSKKKVNPYFGGGLFADYVISGIQQEGMVQYDLTQDIKSINFGLEAEIGIDYWISHEAFGTLGFAYCHGLSNLEMSDESLKIHTFKIGIAIFFSLQ
ncbi:MAG: PorT family protein [Reichenbachiella sp.]